MCKILDFAFFICPKP